MKCVLLAAGEGKRMHPLTFTRPKVMIPISNKPLMEWNLINAIDAGFSEFIFIVAYKSEIVRNYFGDGKKWGVSIEYVNQGKPLGTGHAIGCVEQFVEDFVVLCSDTIFGKQDLKRIKKTNQCIGLFKVEDSRNYGVVEIKNKKVIKIFEKIENPFSKNINAGIYHFDHSVFDFIKKTPRSPRGEWEITDTINMITENHNFKGFFLREWRDMVYPWHLLEVNEEILKNFKGEIQGIIENYVTIKGEVYIGKNTVVMSGSYIKGPVTIGSNCKIGPNCYIRPYTAIGNDCHVGNACEIKNCIILDNNNIPHHNYLGDSVIGECCNFGSGSKIANMKLDKKNIIAVLNGKQLDTKRRKLGAIIGDNVQAGINSKFNVGSMVGNNVFVGPGTLVTGEIKPYTKLL